MKAYDEYAFPLKEADTGDSLGMSLRDFFAAQAMAAIIAKTPFQEFPEDFSPYQKTAIGAYDYADAMIEARRMEGNK